MHEWLEWNKLPVYSPHAFRHGFAIYGKKHAKNKGDLEALRINLKHSSIVITDGIFNEDDIKERLNNLSASGELLSLDEIPPEDREFVLSIYRFYVARKQK